MSAKMSDTIEYFCSLKGVFVKHQLAELVKKVNTNVQDLEYEYQTDGNIVLDEFVIITFKSGYCYECKSDFSHSQRDRCRCYCSRNVYYSDNKV